jgi:tetratricopeptide (TPR) repeat protein
MRSIFKGRDSSQDHYAKGVRLGLAAKYRQASRELAKAIAQQPDSIEAHVSLGVALRKLGELDQALESYGTALGLSKYAEAHYFCANIYYTRRQIPRAIAGYTRAVGLEPALIQAHHGPIPQDRLTDYNKSPSEMYWIRKPAYKILKYDKSLEAHPQQAEIYVRRGEAYYELWNYEQTIADCAAALEIDSRNAHVLHLRGLAHAQLGQLERAITDYSRAVEIQPDFADAFVNLGSAYGKMGDMPRAIASLTEAIRLNPDDLNGYYNRGSAFMRQGEFERAIADFAQVLRATPKDADAYYMRAQAHQEAGHTKQAIVESN